MTGALTPLVDTRPYLTPHSDAKSPKYFLAGGKQTVNLASLNMTTLKALPVPVPSIGEQAEIVRQVEVLLALADSIALKIEDTSRRIDRSSQAVLTKAFRGDLVGSR
jgi:type I restriction enzyme S subunit